MYPSSLRIYLFIESVYHNEDFHHAIEHRFFEHPAIQALENPSHTELTALAHMTGILFIIKTIKHTEQKILDTYNQVLSEVIPEFSNEQQKRFYQEGKERLFQNTKDFVEATGYELKQKWQLPIIEPVTTFSAVVARKSVITSFDGNTQYTETRYKSSIDTVFPKMELSEGAGKEFHLIIGRKIETLSDVLYEAIYTEYVREYLKALYSKTGESYAIWVNTYYEAGYVYAGYYWYTDKTRSFSFQEDSLVFDNESFLMNKDIVGFDTLIGHEDNLYALNAILGFDPNKEMKVLQTLSYEGFSDFLESRDSFVRVYAR